MKTGNLRRALLSPRAPTARRGRFPMSAGPRAPRRTLPPASLSSPPGCFIPLSLSWLMYRLELPLRRCYARLRCTSWWAPRPCSSFGWSIVLLSSLASFGRYATLRSLCATGARVGPSSRPSVPSPYSRSAAFGSSSPRPAGFPPYGFAPAGWGRAVPLRGGLFLAGLTPCECSCF